MSRDWQTVVAEHQETIAALADAEATLTTIADALVASMRAGGRVYVMGNGGSAADAQHIACELLGRFKLERLAQPALALSTDSSTLTAIANDLGYERIFARQLEGLLQTHDAAWLLSTSGNSPNIVAAAEVARTYGVTVVGFTGGTGGKLAPLCDHVFRVPHDASDRIQEAHALAYHFICERVEALLA